MISFMTMTDKVGFKRSVHVFTTLQSNVRLNVKAFTLIAQIYHTAVYKFTLKPRVHSKANKSYSREISNKKMRQFLILQRR